MKSKNKKVSIKSELVAKPFSSKFSTGDETLLTDLHNLLPS